MKPINIRNLVEAIMRNHRKECIFTENACDKIIEELESDPALFNKGSFYFVDKLETAFRHQEIYCPNEGIDRRDEFGLVDTQKMS